MVLLEVKMQRQQALVLLTGATLTEDEVIWSEKLSKGTRTHGIHGARLEVHENSPRHISIVA